MNQKYNTRLESISIKVKENLPVEEAVVLLHKEGCTIVESISFIVSEYKISLKDAKEIVSNHSVWNEVVQASKPMQDELLDSLTNDAKGKI